MASSAMRRRTRAAGVVLGLAPPTAALAATALAWWLATGHPVPPRHEVGWVGWMLGWLAAYGVIAHALVPVVLWFERQLDDE